MKYFKLSEFFKSNVAVEYNISNEPQQSEKDIICNYLNLLGSCVLDHIRQHVGRPIIITSGYRCPEINKLVGGSNTSQHMKGQAADFYVSGYTPQQMREVFNWIIDTLVYDQLIFYPKKNIIHVSYKIIGNRNQHFTKY